MSTMPWGTMNGWLRLETEQRGVWRRQRVQDLRSAQVSAAPVAARAVEVAPAAPPARTQLRPATTAPAATPDGTCAEAA